MNLVPNSGVTIKVVQKLAERYGSENRTEVYRSQLKSRVKGKGETTAELAQSVRKLTR